MLAAVRRPSWFTTGPLIRHRTSGTARNNLPERDPPREEKLTERIELLSNSSGLKPEIAKAVLRPVIDQVAAEHEEVRQYFVDRI